MNPDPSFLSAYLNPESPTVGVFPGMSFDDYKAAPGFNPSLVKKGAPEIKDGGVRGHILKVYHQVWISELLRTGRQIPIGYEPAEKKTKSLDLGSIYHQLLFDPDSFEKHFAVITPELQGALVATAKERKQKDAPKSYSGNMKEAQEYKAKHGALPQTDTAKAMVLKAAQDRFVDEIAFHPRLTEYTEWIADQLKAGRTPLTVDQIASARTMVAAIHDLPANREIAAFLKAEGAIGPERSEVSLFAHYEFNKGGSAQLKGRPDLICLNRSAILDPKSCICCHPWDFANTVDRLGYALQAGAYTLMTDLLQDHESAAGLGFPKKDFGFLAQESNPPYLARLWWLPGQWVRYGAHRFLKIIREVINAANSGDWSGEDDGEYVFGGRETDLDFPGEMLEPPERLLAKLEQF